METVGPPVDDVELHLLTEWGDPASRGRSGVASVASVLLHLAGIVLIVLLPSDFLSSPPEPAKARPLITPLVEPLTEFTQPTPTKGKITKEIDMAALQPRERIHACRRPRRLRRSPWQNGRRPSRPRRSRLPPPCPNHPRSKRWSRSAEDRAATHEFGRAARLRRRSKSRNWSWKTWVDRRHPCVRRKAKSRFRTRRWRKPYARMRTGAGPAGA